MVQFLSILFFSWISSIFVGFFESSRFFVSSCTTHQILLKSKKTKDDERGEACGPYEVQEKFVQDFCAKTWRKETTLNIYAQMGESHKSWHYRKRMGCYGMDSFDYGQGQVCEHGHDGFHYTSETSRISWGINSRIFTVEQATKAQRRSRCIAVSFH